MYQWTCPRKAKGQRISRKSKNPPRWETQIAGHFWFQSCIFLFLFPSTSCTVSKFRNQTHVIVKAPAMQLNNRMQVTNIFTVNFILCPLKANTWRFKNIDCNRKEPKQCINTWQITEVSNSTKRHTDNSGHQVDLCTYRTHCLPQHDLTAQFHLKFLLITQHQVPLITTSEATKMVEWRNRERQMYKCHGP